MFKDEVNQSNALQPGNQRAIGGVAENTTAGSGVALASQRSTHATNYMETIRSLFASFIRFLLKQSYLLSLLTMMVSYIVLKAMSLVTRYTHNLF